MPDPHQFDAQKTATIIGAFITVLTAITWPFRFFLPRSAADKIYVKKVEADGTRAYVHPKEWDDMKARLDDTNTRMDKCLEQGEKWQKLAKDWMEMP